MSFCLFAVQCNTALRRPLRYYDHVLSTKTSKLRSRFIILKTPLIRTPRCYDQEFMVQWWSHQRGSAVSLFERSRCCGRRRRCRGILNSLITRGSRAVHIPVFHSKCGFLIGLLPTNSGYYGEIKFVYLCIQENLVIT